MSYSCRRVVISPHPGGTRMVGDAEVGFRDMWGASGSRGRTARVWRRWSRGCYPRGRPTAVEFAFNRHPRGVSGMANDSYRSLPGAL